VIERFETARATARLGFSYSITKFSNFSIPFFSSSDPLTPGLLLFFFENLEEVITPSTGRQPRATRGSLSDAPWSNAPLSLARMGRLRGPPVSLGLGSFASGTFDVHSKQVRFLSKGCPSQAGNKVVEKVWGEGKGSSGKAESLHW